RCAITSVHAAFGLSPRFLLSAVRAVCRCGLYAREPYFLPPKIVFYVVRYVLRARDTEVISWMGHCSSRLWAKPGSPGPKLTAGVPISEKRATSVQPYLARTLPPTASISAAADGCPNPGSAAPATSSTSKLIPGESKGASAVITCSLAKPQTSSKPSIAPSQLRSGAKRKFTNIHA